MMLDELNAAGFDGVYAMNPLDNWNRRMLDRRIPNELTASNC
jgi:hypothetical protein